MVPSCSYHLKKKNSYVPLFQKMILENWERTAQVRKQAHSIKLEAKLYTLKRIWALESDPGTSYKLS
jgi:hypothetical protein